MTAPTCEEIRAALEARMTHYTHDGGEAKLREAIGEMFDLIDYRALGEDDADAFDSDAIGDDFYCDLRPSEAHRLHELAVGASALAYREARAVIVEAVVAAAVAFGAEYPDAPRRADHPRADAA
jgi:hypothetical protein